MSSPKAIPPEEYDSRAAFFLVTLPGLEDLVVAEVNEWFPEFSCEPVYGGVTVRAPLEAGLAMNLALKTPTRILLRLIHFRCRDFPKLFNKLLDFQWERWIHSDVTLEIQASSRESRVKIKKRIEATAADAWKKYQAKKKVTADPEKKLTLYIRFQKDDCTVSLDTSGERLHKRGMRKWVGEAPLRETIAAAMLQLTLRTLDQNGEQEVEIIDPMLGSGTFLIEAATRNEIIETREFAFHHFVSEPKTSPHPPLHRPRIQRLIGYELDAKTFEAAKENLKAAKSKIDIQLYAKDFFQLDKLNKSSFKRLVMMNPPYGERLKIKGDPLEYYVKIFHKVYETFQPDRLCLLMPSQIVKGKFRLPPGWKVLAKRPFSNGGIGVVGFVFGT